MPTPRAGPTRASSGLDGVLYACQNGGTVGPWRAEEMLPPSIQRIPSEGGAAEIIATGLDGVAFHGPNDLVFGPDGRLYITDPGTYRPADPEPSRLFVMEPDGTGRLLAELDPADLPQWHRGRGRRQRRLGRVVHGHGPAACAPTRATIEDIARLPGEKPVADGMAVGPPTAGCT